MRDFSVRLTYSILRVVSVLLVHLCFCGSNFFGSLVGIFQAFLSFPGFLLNKIFRKITSGIQFGYNNNRRH